MDTYIPRIEMPQVDDADHPALLQFLNQMGVRWVTCDLPAHELRFRQRLEDSRLVSPMPPEIERRPVLVSEDRYVIDGNHREEAHLADGTPVRCVVIHLPFDQAVETIFCFDKTYTVACD